MSLAAAFSFHSQGVWWQNTAMPQMAQGNRTGQRKFISLIKPLRKGLERQDERDFLSSRFLNASDLSAEGGKAGLGCEGCHPKPQITALEIRHVH